MICALALTALSACNKGEPAPTAVDRAKLKAEIKDELRAELEAELAGLKAELRDEVRTGRLAKKATESVDPKPEARPGKTPDPGPAADEVKPTAPSVAEPEPGTDGPAAEPVVPTPEPGQPDQPAEPVESAMEVMDLQVAESVDRAKRMPVGAATSFDSTVVQKLYAFLIVKNEGEPAMVSVEWFHNGERRGKLDLRIGQSNRGWRTWSTSKISARRTGQWSVKVIDPNGVELKSLDFEVR